MDEVEKYLQEQVNATNHTLKDRSRKKNESPCSVCKKTEFVQLFRNVVGKISGHMHGSFSFFGGSFSGHIDGYTKTLPVLSCRHCNNERKIDTYQAITKGELFWEEMYWFYFGVDKDDQERLNNIKKVFIDNPEQTRAFAESNKNYEYKFYNEIVDWSADIWEKAGFRKLRRKEVYKKYWIFKSRHIKVDWSIPT